MSNSKLINIILLGGDLEGVRVVDTEGNVRGILCPRSLFSDAKSKRKEFERPGVYLLTGTHEKGELTKVYVGKSKRIGQRIISQDYDKDWWETLICFTSRDDSLNEAHAGYLESKLISLAQKVNQCKLDNKNTHPPSLPETDTIFADNFLKEILLSLSVLGYSYFEIPRKKRGKQEILHLKAGGINAKGYESSEGFVVLKGSEAVLKPGNALYERYRGLRDDLKKNRVFKEESGKLVLTQDYTFTSSSSAASVLSGNVISGLTSWKNQKGVVLKELQEKKAAL